MTLTVKLLDHSSSNNNSFPPLLQQNCFEFFFMHSCTIVVYLVGIAVYSLTES